MAPFFSWLFGGEPPRQPPAPVPTDTIIKLGVLENSLMMKSLYSRYFGSENPSSKSRFADFGLGSELDISSR